MTSAKRSVATFGLPEDIDPAQALLDEVQRTAGHVRWLGAVVAGLKQDDLVWGKAEELSTPTGPTIKYKSGPSVWVQLYQTERKHLAQVCAAAISAGVSERMVKVYERVGDVFVEMMEGVLSDLELTDAQRARVPAAVVSRLQALTEESA